MRFKLSKKAKLIIISSLLAAVFIWIASDLYISNNSFTVSHYKITDKRIENEIRIVQLSDLHNHEFGDNNDMLINEIEKLEPDIILTTGDMLDGYEKEYQAVGSLISRLCKIAPVYSSYGNHELMYDEYANLKSESVYSENGALLLDMGYVEIPVNGQEIRLGGVYGYCLPEIYIKGDSVHREASDFVKEFQNTEVYTVLMCHMPVCFIENNGLDLWKVDLVFSGHAHAGQLRIPFIGGLYAPDQGFFPGTVKGVYSSQNGNKKLILSGGLGSSNNIPRFNNIPELVVADILPE